MALPGSGPVSVGDINLEKGNAETAANSSLTTLSTTDINDLSSSKPDGIAPHAMSEFHGYDHDATVVPSAFAAGWDTGTTVNLSWNNPVITDEQMTIQWRDDPGDAWTTLTSTKAAGSTDHAHTTATAASTNYYRIQYNTSSGADWAEDSVVVS